jgi:DNA polymerase-1
MHQIVEKVKTSGLYVKTKEPEKDEDGKYISKEFNCILLDTKEKLFDVLDKIQPNDIVAFDTETTGLDVQNDKIVGFSFCFNKNDAYYVPINHIGLMGGKQIPLNDAKEFLIHLLKHQIVGHNLKFDMHILFYNFGIKEHNILADTLIIAWLLNPASEKSLDALSKKFLHHQNIKFKDILPRGGTFADIDIQNASVYASEDAWVSYKLYNILVQKLDPTLLKLCDDVEYPFIQTLLFIEQNGIKIDIDFFERFEIITKENIKELTEQIHHLCGEVFNINSTKQLGIILFEKLKLTVIKKTKTGYSTDEQSLSEIINEHDVIKKIMKYREIYKLQSTYIEPLKKLGNNNNENAIFTSFLQTGTASGRLSSNNPNLQNIPVGQTLGTKIREGFIAREGCHLIGIDYSQIELRLLAHFSQDKYLVDAFLNNKDIHLQTAIEIFGKEEASTKRDIAKTINFGILYGMGSRKLAKMLDIPVKEAKEYILKYFNTFVNVDETIENIKDFMQKNGYVETLLKRKRYFDFEKASAFEASNFLRMGVNTVFQGSAGDLIKLAMNKI